MLEKVKTLEECKSCDVYHSSEDDCNISEDEKNNNIIKSGITSYIVFSILIYILTPKGCVIITQLIYFVLVLIESFLMTPLVEKLLEKVYHPKGVTIRKILNNLTFRQWVIVSFVYYLTLYKIPSYFAPKGLYIIYAFFSLKIAYIFLQSVSIILAVYIIFAEKKK